MFERFLLKLGIAGLFVVLVIAVLSTAGCGTVAGLCQDVSAASNAIAEAASKNHQAQCRN